MKSRLEKVSSYDMGYSSSCASKSNIFPFVNDQSSRFSMATWRNQQEFQQLPPIGLEVSNLMKTGKWVTRKGSERWIVQELVSRWTGLLVGLVSDHSDHSSVVKGFNSQRSNNLKLKCPNQSNPRVAFDLQRKLSRFRSNRRSKAFRELGDIKERELESRVEFQVAFSPRLYSPAIFIRRGLRRSLFNTYRE